GTNVTVGGAAARLRTGGTTSAISNLASVAGSLRLTGFVMSLTPAGGVFDLSGTLTLDPGTVLSVTGNYNQSSASTLVLNMDAAGDTGKGRITVSGVASVDGALVINFLGQYIQPLCVPSNILTAQSINGLFSALTLPRDESRIYATTGNSFLLVAQSPADIASAGGAPIPDGFITGEDFDLYIQAFFAELRRPPPDNTLIADLVNDVGALPPDGFLTGSDFDYFVLRFFRGCDF
ncbi:MAG: hypothetical protein JNJ48_02370, partial [Phycisphaerae bacterium]|nr:hypothetical protein [Phycisphaerae bacterium]